MRCPASQVRATSAPHRRALLLAVLTAACASSWAAAAPEAVYWRQRVFFIPYQPVAGAADIEKVQLLVARDGAGEWAVLQEAEPHVRGFSYHAPVDGDYSFAVRTSDRKGNLSPAIIAQPQLRVVVDTTPPSLQVGAALDATGRVVVRYEARDVQLKPETLRLEVQNAAGSWERLATGPPDVSQPDRVVGQLAWKPPTAASNLKFRATIDDRAGNQFASTADASLIGPTPTIAAGSANSWGPALGSATGDAPPLVTAAPAAATPPTRAGVEWPSANSVAVAGVGAPPPQSSPSANTEAPVAPPLWPQERTPAQLVADSGATARPSSAQAGSPFGGSSTGATNPFGPPPLMNTTPERPTSLPDLGSSAPSAPAGAPPAVPAGEGGTRWVNSLTFDVDYDLQTVGPWGVSKVELWATRDGGREWVNFGVDPDNRSPMRVNVPTAGVYGFRLIVNGANGAAVPTPVAGEQPELVIGVDLSEPQGELQAAEIGQGNMADHLLIRWSASDENLDAGPVGLFYGTDPQGPWSTIATDIDNNGQYAWRLLRQVPEKLFLRLEVRDKAGNVAVRTTPAPVMLNLPQPTGRLRSVRPVQEPQQDPSRFRTANGGAAGRAG